MIKKARFHINRLRKLTIRPLTVYQEYAALLCGLLHTQAQAESTFVDIHFHCPPAANEICMNIIQGSRRAYDGGSFVFTSACSANSGADLQTDLLEGDLPCMILDSIRILCGTGVLLLSGKNLLDKNATSFTPFGMTARGLCFALQISGEACGVARYICKIRKGSLLCFLFDGWAGKCTPKPRFFSV
jgi:hypothetical protein